MESSGRRMDEFAAKTEKDMRVAENGVNKFGRTAEQTTTKVSGSFATMDRAIAKSTSSAQRNLGQMQAHMAVVDAQMVRPDVDIDIAGAMAQLAILKREINAVSRMKINVGSGGAMGAAAAAAATPSPTFRQRMFAAAKAGAMSFARSRTKVAGRRLWGRIKAGWDKSEEIEATDDAHDRFVRNVSRSGGIFGSVGERMASWLKIILAAGPALEAVAGAAGGLIGSLGGATMGAGVGLAGILGTATVGLGGFLGAIVPVAGELKTAKQALDSYNKSVLTYGKNSQEAQKKLAIYERTGTPSARRFLDIWGGVKEGWKNRTTRGRREATGMLGDMAGDFRSEFMPQFAGVSNRSAAAMRVGGNTFMDTLDSPTFHRNLDILSKTFGRVTPMFGQAMANLARVMTNISAAARPQTIEFFKWLNEFMAGANKDTSNLDKLDAKFKRWTREFKLWVRFFKELGLLTITFFGSGKKSGDSLIKEWTGSIRDLRKEWEQDPRGLENWFDKQTSNFKKLLREIAELTRALGEMVDMLSNLVGPLADVSQSVRNATGGGLVGSLASVATMSGLYFGARGLGRAGARSLGKRLPGAAGDYFLNKGGMRRVSTGGTMPGSFGPTTTAAEGGGMLSKAGRFLLPVGAGIVAHEMGEELEGRTSLPGWLTYGPDDYAVDLANKASSVLGGTDRKFGGLSGLTMRGMGENTKAIHRSLAGMETIQNAYEGGGASESKAFRKALSPGLHQLKVAGPAGAKILSSNMLMWANQQRKENPKLEGVYDELVQTVKRKYARMGRDIAVINGEIFSGSKKQWEGISRAITGPTAQAVQRNKEAFTTMQMQAVGALMGLGYKKSTAMGLIQGLEHGKGAVGQVASHIASGSGSMAPYAPGYVDRVADRGNNHKRAGGGTIPGNGLQDSVMLGGAKVAPGESWIATRHQRELINRELPPGQSLERIINTNKRWHSSPPPMGRYQGGGGGSIVPAPGFPGERINSRVIPAFTNLVKRFNLTLTDAYGPGHQSSEHTEFGTAIDVVPGPGGTWQDVDRAVAYSVKSGYTPVYYDGRFGSTNLPPHGPGHHAHITLLSAGELAGGQTPRMGRMGRGMGATSTIGRGINIKVPKSKLGGVAGAMNQRVMDIYGAGLEQKVNKRLGAGQGMGPGGFKGATGTLGFGQLVQLAQRAGMDNPTLMAHIAMAESGGRVGVVNSIGAAGLWQIYNHPDLVAKYGPMTNAWNNARAARDLLQTQGLGAWAASEHAWSQYRQGGGSVNFAGWMAKGGKFTVDRPTLFGAGEAGIEDVEVKPRDISQASKGSSGSSGGVVVHIGTIENHRRGDIRRQIEEEFAALGVSLANHVEDEDDLR